MKFHLSFLWILFFILAYFSNIIKTYLIIFVLLFIHEMGHIFIAKFFKYEVSDLYIFPFGFSAKIQNLDYATSIEMFFIILGGLIMHVLFYYVLLIIYHYDLISISYYEYLQRINISIVLFNLLPIYPLDGSRLLFSLLNLFISYDKCKLIIYIISILLILLIFVHSPLSLKIILVLLFYLIIKDYRNFDLERVEVRYYKEKHFNVKKNHV